MRLALLYREQVASLKSHLVDELDEMVSAIGGWAATEHDDDGRHTDITADSVTTDLLTAITATITNLTISGTIILTGFTPGSVLFAGPLGEIAQDNVGLFWDDTNNRFSVRSPQEGSITVISDVNNISGDTDAFVLFRIDGNPGTLKGGIGYDQGLDRFILGYSFAQLVQISQAGNMLIPQSLQVGSASLPASGTAFVVFPDGTIPVTPASNTAMLYGDDVSGTVSMFAMNEDSFTQRLANGLWQDPLAPSTNQVLAANTSAVVVRKHTIASGTKLTLGLGSRLRIL